MYRVMEGVDLSGVLETFEQNQSFIMTLQLAGASVVALESLYQIGYLAGHCLYCLGY